jgi:hypothetical protein
MNEIISSINISNYINTLSNIYRGGTWKNREHVLVVMRSLIVCLRNVKPNEWYLTDEEDALIAEAAKAVFPVAEGEFYS